MCIGKCILWWNVFMHDWVNIFWISRWLRMQQHEALFLFVDWSWCFAPVLFGGTNLKLEVYIASGTCVCFRVHLQFGAVIANCYLGHGCQTISFLFSFQKFLTHVLFPWIFVVKTLILAISWNCSWETWFGPQQSMMFTLCPTSRSFTGRHWLARRLKCLMFMDM